MYMYTYGTQIIIRSRERDHMRMRMHAQLFVARRI